LEELLWVSEVLLWVAPLMVQQALVRVSEVPAMAWLSVVSGAAEFPPLQKVFYF
jgi:hypothetical protein